jgi:hypothetical protein
LRMDWRGVLPPEQCSYVLGNPPFVGYAYQTAEQRSDMELFFGKIKGAGVLDYVACWYAKAADYIHVNPLIDVAFVSTNSITQGEQVSILWGHLLAKGIHIRFAHRTFQWSNEGKGVAAVHCVIVGFGLNEPKQRVIFDYGDNIKGEPVTIAARNINPYLVDAPNVLLDKRRAPICAVPEMSFGSKPTDGGNLLLSDAEKQTLLQTEPQAEKWIRPFLGSEEFINNIPRWCLWLKGISPAELRAMPQVMRRIEAVKAMRLVSTKAATVELASSPMLFGETRQPNSDYIGVPKTSSERRSFIPVGFCDSNTVAGSELFSIPNATLYHFGILSSTMHNAWMRYTCGRLKSDYRYSNTIVYNNFPWPDASDKHNSAIEAAAQAILDARALYPESSLADLYDPLSMPPELVKAHAALDKAVDAAYQYKGGKDDAARVAFLFERYQQLTSLLPAVTTKPKRNTTM